MGSSLCKQTHFNLGNQSLKYYPANVAPFIGLQHWTDIDLQELNNHLPADRSFSVMITKEVALPTTFEIVFTTPLYQLYCGGLKPFANNGLSFRKLEIADVPQMLELTDLTKPGPLYERTIEFGTYVGIFDKDKLVAMAGERLKINGYTEVSAICTHPDYLGKGYASFLLSNISGEIIKEENIQFLHVRQDNSRAIDVYKKLGFQIRGAVYFAVFKKKN